MNCIMKKMICKPHVFTNLKFKNYKNWNFYHTFFDDFLEIENA